jgi:hypothetical protein
MIPPIVRYPLSFSGFEKSQCYLIPNDPKGKAFLELLSNEARNYV